MNALPKPMATVRYKRAPVFNGQMCPLACTAKLVQMEVLGHTICAVTDTESATVAAALLHHPDLMIVDEGLRNGSGIDAVQDIEMTLSVPHIFATGDIYRVLKAEPNAIVLQKPYQAAALLRAIERATPPAIGSLAL